MSDKRVEIGRVDGMPITAEPSVLWASLLMWLVVALLGRRVWRLKPGAAVAGGLLATGLHFFSEIWHQLGHARAARRTGYPMTGVHLYTALGTSVYPPDEPSLPGEVHVARALGGPRASLLLAIAGSALALLTWPLRGPVSLVTSLFALDNLLVFTLGALLPLPMIETDGSVLRRHLRQPRTIVIQE
jgi:hypothetical protein